MIVLVKTLQVILALSILIIIHELGHFAFAKLFKIRVEKFYLFFDVGGHAIWRFKPKGSDTEYGIGWLPLGGYCKIAGMVDESMDTDSLKEEPKEWEFRTKSAPKRLLVMAGGVLFNFILAIVLYIAILAIWGEGYISNEGSSIYVNDLAYDMGFRTGDHIISFDDYEPENFGMLQADLARRTVGKATVLRDGDTLDIYIDQSKISDVLNSPSMFSLAVPFIVDSIPPTSPNYGSTLSTGDQIVALGGDGFSCVQESREILAQHKDGEVEALVVGADADTSVITLKVDSLGLMGVYLRTPDSYRTKKYSVLEAIPAGFKRAFSNVSGYVMDLKLVATPSTGAYKSVGSFISIGKIFPSKWDWYSFTNILALLSIMLGVMNLLPIPGLDGGHIVFTLYEMITRHKPSDNFMIGAQIVGMAILIGIMILAFGNDIAGLFR